MWVKFLKKVRNSFWCVFCWLSFYFLSFSTESICLLYFVLFCFVQSTNLICVFFFLCISVVCKNWMWSSKEFNPTILEGLTTTDHSLAQSHYWPTRKLLAAGFPLWPGSPLFNQPAPPGFPQEDHVDASLSADTNSTWISWNQNPLPHTVLNTGLPDAGLQEYAKLPAIWSCCNFPF